MAQAFCPPVTHSTTATEAVQGDFGACDCDARASTCMLFGPELISGSLARPLQSCTGSRTPVMSARRHKDPPEQPSPFNNPFVDGMRKIKRELARARKERANKRAERGGQGQTTDDVGTTASRANVSTQSDAEVFADAMDGTVPLNDPAERVGSTQSYDRMASCRDDAEETIDPTSLEHFDVRFSDRYVRAKATSVSRETLARLERGEFAVRSHVDLHGMLLEDARRVVDDFLEQCHRRGERCVLVITGKGRNSSRQVGVLRENIPQWLARGPSSRRVLAYVTARPCDGGEGALYVLLRKHAARKARIDVESGGGI